MYRFLIGCGLAALCLALPMTAKAADVTYDNQWSYNQQKGYYYKTCYFPSGAHQYLIVYPTHRDWLYWYNPQKRVYWAACPTIYNQRWGNAVSQGRDLFLKASKKSSNLRDTMFPDPGSDGANFQPGTTTDVDGSQISLGCPQTDDLP